MVSLLDSKVVRAKITNNQVKVKGERLKAKRETKSKAAEPKPSENERKATFTDEQFLEALKNIGDAATSREISDKLGISQNQRST
jgi:hypothetical protein